MSGPRRPARAPREGEGDRPLSRGRQRLFITITLLTPVALLALVEVLLRLSWPGGARPVAFDPVEVGGVRYFASSPNVARRYFAARGAPPAPPVDLFAASKPARSLRIFVLGESTAAGFPFPRNGTFSRVLRDALQDVLPGEHIEVINLGIAATNSYTVADLVPDVLAQRPDAVLIYSGHNEYYGALGVGSSIGVGASAVVVRSYLLAQRLRTFMALRAAAVAFFEPRGGLSMADSSAASLMESIAGKQAIRYGDAAYTAGLHQYRNNIGAAVRQLRMAGVPVYLGSIESNVRSQRPFSSTGNAGAAARYEEGLAALASGDRARARFLLFRARDEDEVRFRAPSALGGVIRAIAAAEGARYVPVAEFIGAASTAGIPGDDLFLEHVHPTARGQVLIARQFFESLQHDGFLGRAPDLGRLASWDDYQRRMELTPFDERIVHHTVRTVTTRWPFVDRARALDYRGTVRAVGTADSLALLVSRGGMPWAAGKLQVALDYERRMHFDSALAEYRGLVRDAPQFDMPHRLAGRALLALGRLGEATEQLERAQRLAVSAEGTYLLGMAALQGGDLPRAIVLLDRASELAPGSATVAYQLSRAFARAGQAAAAQGAATRAAQLDRQLPGLAGWMATLGLPAP